MNCKLYDGFILASDILIECDSDHFDCKTAGCTDPNNRNCKGWNCIPKELVNNGNNNCNDGSDEGIAGTFTEISF